jgi:hypothetical protein
VLALRWTFGRGGNADEATKLAAVWVSLLTGALGALASLSVAFVQRENNKILADVQEKVARRLEVRKARIGAEQKAYDELCAAASYYYYAVKQLETGQFEKALTRKAESGMVSACRHLVAVTEEDTRTWMQVWQRCRFIAQEVSVKKPEERESLFKTHLKQLDDYYKEFFEAARKHHLADDVISDLGT